MEGVLTPRTRILPLLLILAAPASAPADELRLGSARVNVSVADLRKEPQAPGPTLEHDPLEESQLLYADPVTVLEIQEEWARVAAPDQQEWTHNRRWEGYPGWVRVSDLAPEPAGWEPNVVVVSKWAQVRGSPAPDGPAGISLPLGTRLPGSEKADGWKVRLLDGSEGWLAAGEAQDFMRWRATDEDSTRARRQIVAAARLFLGDPYYWGGRSPHDPEGPALPHTAVDCSGLTGLAYQAADVWIPRDAHEQWMKARPIARENLQPGDLVFLADPENALKITHVMLYAGDGRIIEGPGTGTAVRELPLEERLKEAAGRRAHYGSCL